MVPKAVGFSIIPPLPPSTPTHGLALLQALHCVRVGSHCCVCVLDPTAMCACWVALCVGSHCCVCVLGPSAVCALKHCVASGTGLSPHMSGNSDGSLECPKLRCCKDPVEIGFHITHSTRPLGLPFPMSSVCCLLVELILPEPLHPGEGGPWSGELLHLQVCVTVLLPCLL